MPSIAKISDLIKEKNLDVTDASTPEDASATPVAGLDLMPTPVTVKPTTKKTTRVRWPLWVALILLAAATVVGWQVARRYLIWDNFGVVEPGKIYRSGQLQPFQLEYLIKNYKIKTILKTNIPELSPKGMAQEQIICNRNNVKVVRLIMPGDGRGDFAQYDQAIDLLHDQRSLPVLITCARGTYRTGAIVACYRVLVQSWSIDKALEEMQNYRFSSHRRARSNSDEENPLTAHLRAYFKERTGYE